jgi:acyl-coenzyme A thioesterase PaaI-like protein
MSTMDCASPSPTTVWVFGNQPLPQTLALAPILRRLTERALSLEQEDEWLARVIEELSATERTLAQRGPGDPTPRIGPDPRPDQRVYLDHGRDIGKYNPCFPEYEIRVEGERASGTVSFPLAFEGPPAIVHGGFLAVFFDCAIQHHNCDYGTAGKTTALNIEYLRPAPILRVLQFEIERASDARRITSTASIKLDGSVLCRATMEAVVGDRSRLPEVSPRQNQR